MRSEHQFVQREDLRGFVVLAGVRGDLDLSESGHLGVPNHLVSRQSVLHPETPQVPGANQRPEQQQLRQPTTRSSQVCQRLLAFRRRLPHSAYLAEHQLGYYVRIR